MKHLTFSFLIVSTLLSCSAKKTIEVDPSESKSGSKGMYEQTTEFMVCSVYPNIFQSETVDKKPLPIQGEDKWIRDLYMALRYPAASRENGVQGTVILEIWFGSDGTVEAIALVQQVSLDIDNAAVEAFRKASIKGFTPAVYKGMPVRCKATIPLHFRLG
ncbi:MAG: TonB family protein [Saprospiraceae bacterium]|jgi:TonB family protein